MFYYSSEPQRKTSYRNTSVRIVENHVDPPWSTKFNKRSPFVLKKEVPLYRESKLQILTKTIEYMEVKEHSLLIEIVNDSDEDIHPYLSFETCFEIFTHPKSLDTPEITSTEKKYYRHKKSHLLKFQWINIKFVSSKKLRIVSSMIFNMFLQYKYSIPLR